ncbi:MAG: hypothetical protein JRJ73_15385, partial [Deltaproteobacteria bacterium]|nr:hypothetical protein [Deltaproteobacteria bacterium]
ATPLDNQAVGTGRFMVEEGRPGNYLKLKRNPNWWFGKSIGLPDMPYFDGWLINVIPDPSVQLANLRAGKIDAMNVDPSQYLLTVSPDQGRSESQDLQGQSKSCGVHAFQYGKWPLQGYPGAQGHLACS